MQPESDHEQRMREMTEYYRDNPSAPPVPVLRPVVQPSPDGTYTQIINNYYAAPAAPTGPVDQNPGRTFIDRLPQWIMLMCFTAIIGTICVMILAAIAVIVIGVIVALIVLAMVVSHMMKTHSDSRNTRGLIELLKKGKK